MTKPRCWGRERSGEKNLNPGYLALDLRKGGGFFKFLARFFPCLTFPCRNGGTCVSGSELEVFSCDCPLEIKALPYTDDKCNVGKFGNLGSGI